MFDFIWHYLAVACYEKQLSDIKKRRPMNLYSSHIPDAITSAQPSSWDNAMTALGEQRGFQFLPRQRAALAQILSRPASLLRTETAALSSLLVAAAITLRTSGSETVVIVAETERHARWIAEIRRFIGRRVTQIEHPGEVGIGINIISPYACSTDRKFTRPVSMIIVDEPTPVFSFSCTCGVPYRLALTAAQTPDRLDVLFSLLGWLSAPSGNTVESGATFPYRPDELARFLQDYGPSDMSAGTPPQVQDFLSPYYTYLPEESAGGGAPIVVECTPCSIAASAQEAWGKCFQAGKLSTIEMEFLTMPDRVKGKAAAALVKLSRLVAANQQVIVIASKESILRTMTEVVAFDVPFSLLLANVSDSTVITAVRDFESGKSRVLFVEQKAFRNWTFPNCNHVIMLGNEFSYAAFHQTLRRCNSLSEEGVRVYVLYYPTTNEPLILEQLMRADQRPAPVAGDRRLGMGRALITRGNQVVSDSGLTAQWEEIKKSFHKVLDTARAISV